MKKSKNNVLIIGLICIIMVLVIGFLFYMEFSNSKMKDLEIKQNQLEDETRQNQFANIDCTSMCEVQKKDEYPWSEGSCGGSKQIGATGRYMGCQCDCQYQNMVGGFSVSIDTILAK